MTGASAKRQKTDGETDGDAPTFAAPAQDTAQPEATVEAEAAPAQDTVEDGANDALPTSSAAPVVADQPQQVDANEPAPEPAQVETKTKGKKVKVKAPPVKDGFDAWNPAPFINNPPKNDFWGTKPVTGDPRPHPDQPSARDSDAATNPPMWEERNYRFKRGSRYVKYQGPIKPGVSSDDDSDIDQENFMIMQLIDMRPVSKHDQSPRRQPTSYFFEHGKPKDWNNMQAVKALNDRRGQAIDRVTMDAPWSKIEREYLSQLFNNHPDASIWELTERHNDRFKGQDFTGATGFTFTKVSDGRTVESVRAEYMTYKPAYDGGEPPKNVRWRTDKSPEGKALRKANDNKMEAAFGKPNKKLQKDFDEAAGEDGSDDESGAEGEKTPKKSTPQKKSAVKKAPKTPKTPKTPKKDTTKKSKAKKETPKQDSPKAADNDASDSDDEGEIQYQAAHQMAAQPKLNDEDEALLDLAGINNPEEIRNSHPHIIPSATPPRRAFSWSSGSDLSDVNTDKPDSSAPAKAAKSRAPSLANDAQPAQDVQSPGAVAFDDAVAAVSEEAVANAVAAQQPATAAPSVHAPSEQEVVVAQQTVVQQTVIVKQQVARVPTPERSSPAPAPASKTPSPKAARDITINEDYDEDEDAESEDEEL